MALINKTIYPVIPKDLSQKVIAQHYTLCKAEVEFTINKTLTANNQVYFAILFKTYQNLGYFIELHKVPPDVVSQIALSINIAAPSDYDLFCYDKDRIKEKHTTYVRSYFKSQIATSKIVADIATKVANSKSNLIDIINGTIEELLATLYELPNFFVLEKQCTRARRTVNAGFCELMYRRITRTQERHIKNNILIYGDKGVSNWQKLKQEPPKISITNIKNFATHVRWLEETKISPTIFEDISQIKLDSLFEEAYSYNFFEIKRLKKEKQYALIALVIHQQLLTATDDLVYMLIKYMSDMENDAREDLKEYMLNKLDDAEILIGKFKNILSDYKRNKSTAMLKSMRPNELESLIEKCDEYNAYSKHKHLYFFYKRYLQSRRVILRCVDMVNIDNSSPANDVIHMVDYLKNLDIDILSITKDDALKLGRIPGRWKSFCKIKNGEVDRIKLEMYIINSLIKAIKDREIYILRSRNYTDYKCELITWSEYRAKIWEYSNIVNLPVEPTSFSIHIKNELCDAFDLSNSVLDASENADIKNDKLILRKIVGKSRHKDYKKLDGLLDNEMQQISLLNIITTITKRLDLHDYFERASGESIRMDDHLKQVIATIFCYGCNISAREGERSIVDVNRKQIGRINTEHISESSLNKCIQKIVETYNRFALPQIWGDGKHVSVDGTKWDVYSKNLMAQYHIRYRGYGGIGYYHVSNNYIALFSNFITCGVYEGRYLLDGIDLSAQENNPDYIHGDTHSQSFVIFALAYLLGIKVMPRIRHLQDLTLYKPEKNQEFDLTDSLFTNAHINWRIIMNNTEEMFRVVISIKEGKIRPSEFLNKLAYCGGRNKLYMAFRELGRALRTTYILTYIGDFDLRKEVHAATCKSEEFNEFVNWVSFANNTIRSNHRIEQRKFIKYNHLVTNMVLLYTIEEMTRVIKLASTHGIEISEDLLKQFSPYRKEHIIRLGKYEMDLEMVSDNSEWNFDFC